jgi:cellulose synthase/poly-beta-1,6-N-acetylglucosamine synthase-like glycosyltransferase
VRSTDRRRARRTPAWTWTGTGLAVALTAHTAWNTTRLRRPPADPPEVLERVSVLVPARDEESALPALLDCLAEQTGVADLEVLVCDDGSTDRTAQVAADASRRDPRVRLVRGLERPPGWLGKPFACHQLAGEATGSSSSSSTPTSCWPRTRWPPR